MEVAIRDIEWSMAVCARIIREREDGRKFVPLFKRLEEELKSRRSTEDDYERILRQYEA